MAEWPKTAAGILAEIESRGVYAPGGEHHRTLYEVVDQSDADAILVECTRISLTVLEPLGERPVSLRTGQHLFQFIATLAADTVLGTG